MAYNRPVMDEKSALAAPEGIERDGLLDAGDLGSLAWITHVGHIRSRNEDRLLVRSAWDGSFVLALVADGAGGHDAGDKAAELVATTFHEAFPEEGEPPEGAPETWLLAAIELAHSRVTALSTGSSRPPASTVVGLLVERATQAVWRFHVGDSRIYARLSDGTMEPWTRDHNIINGLIDRGLPVAQALKIAEGGRLTQVVGGAASPEIEIAGPFALRAGSTLSITSDGAYAYHPKVEGFVDSLDRSTGTPGDRCAALRESVLSGPAPDNLTAVLWDVPEELPKPASGRDLTARVLGGPEDILPAENLPLKEGWDVGSELMESVTEPPPSLSSSSTDDTLDPDEMFRGHPPSPGAGFGTFLAVVLGLFLVIAFLRSRQDDEYPRQVFIPPPIEAVQEVEESTPEPSPPDPAFVQALGAIDPAWWSELDPQERSVREEVLERLFAPPSLPNTVLSAPTGQAGATTPKEFPGWPQAGGPGAVASASVWAAAKQILGEYPILAAEPPVAARVRSAACARVSVGWPRVKGAEELGGELADWITHCLPGEGDTLTVHLGDWPHAGWTLGDVDALVSASSKPGGSEVLTRPGVDVGPRMTEFAMLVEALGDARVADLVVDLEIHLPGREASADERDPVPTAQAVQRLLRGAVEGSGANITVGAVSGDPLVVAQGEVSPSIAARLGDLNRRIDVTLTRASSLDSFELEDEIPEVPRPPTPAPPPAPPPAPTPSEVPSSADTAAPSSPPRADSSPPPGG